MPKSKPSALNDYPVTEFYPAVLKNYPNAGWRIEYYVLNPQTQTMVCRIFERIKTPDFFVPFVPLPKNRC